MPDTPTALKQFIGYAATLDGDEKGEAQVFLDRLFIAFGHAGYKEAGATLEFRVAQEHHKRFADLVWKPRLVLEMKKRGEKLQLHYRQLFNYWLGLVPRRPQYAILCNFDEFWIYEFDIQMEEPMDIVSLADLPKRYTALNFLLPEAKKPLFGNDRVAVTRKAADKLAQVFQSLIHRRVDRECAQRFVLQCLVAIFSEDIELLPRGLFCELLEECENGGSTYDLIGGLFRQMNSPEAAQGGRFKEVRYFDGGLFERIEPVDLKSGEVLLLDQAAREDWSKVQPAIFGSIFQSSIEKEARHAFGAHFTSEADIQKVVQPTVVAPFQERIEHATTLRELLDILDALRHVQVLDPACGSGNFLYVAYRELKRVEAELLLRIHRDFEGTAARKIRFTSFIRPTQFHGIDKIPFAVELAKVTLTLARELAILETREIVQAGQALMPLASEAALPLDNLDKNILCDDALFCGWPQADLIIGNPPYQSKNKMQQEYGRAYLNALHERYPEVPGRADYCVFWFRRAHDELKPGGRAGLVGTNTIRQNYSREGGLDFIVGHGGTITEAVSTQVWSGDAVVHVSIVNWIKGAAPGTKRLFTQSGDSVDSPWDVRELPIINSSLSAGTDVGQATRLEANAKSRACYQGQTHGHEGFLFERRAAESLIEAHPEYAEVLFPYLIADELLGTFAAQPSRYVIDFQALDVTEAARYKIPFAHIRKEVLHDREKAADEEQRRNRDALKDNPQAHVNHHHANFLRHWWVLSYAREEMIKRLSSVPRYVTCARVTKRPIFEFVSSQVRPNDALMVFPLADDYSFGILQSSMHWEWFKARCSTLKRDWRYTSDTVFDTFVWPQAPKRVVVRAVAKTAVHLRTTRNRIMERNQWSLRDLYRTLDQPGENPLRDAHAKLDALVRAAYEMRPKDEPLRFLMALNHELAEAEAAGKQVQGPGLPDWAEGAAGFVTEDCVRLR